MAERLARQLSERLGEDAVTAHHGSLSKEKRLDAEAPAEERAAEGAGRDRVAGAGHRHRTRRSGVPDRIAAPHRHVPAARRPIRAHRVGAAEGPAVPGVARRPGRVRRAAALGARTASSIASCRTTRRSTCWRSRSSPKSRAAEYSEDELFALVARRLAVSRARARRLRRGGEDDWPTASRRAAGGARRSSIATRSTRRSAAGVAARLLAITSGGAIPEVADYRVVLEPEDTFIGTLNEDFAIESMAGDVFQLGNASWQVLQVGAGVVRVARRARRAAEHSVLAWRSAGAQRRAVARGERSARRDRSPLQRSRTVRRPSAWLAADSGVARGRRRADRRLSRTTAERALGVLPTQETLVLERFFDESGGMQLVLHAPFGSRINKAWGLALRKRFCRQFNFELQAAATEDALLLSLGPQHSFPLADVFRYLHPATVRDVLVQAFLDAPVFQTRWRWNTTISLAVPRNRGGKKVRAAAAAHAGRRPDGGGLSRCGGLPREHSRRSADSRSSARGADGARLPAGSDGLRRARRRCSSGSIAASCSWSRATRPSRRRSAHECSTRARTRFWTTRRSKSGGRMRCTPARASEPAAAGDLGALDAAAIARVRDEARPDPRDADELHDALLTAGFLLRRRRRRCADAELVRRTGRGAPGARVRGRPDGPAVWMAAERLPELRAIIPARDRRRRGHAAGVARGAGVDARRGARRDRARPH